MPTYTDLAKLKLDLVYRGVDRSTIRTKFVEKTNPTAYQEQQAAPK